MFVCGLYATLSLSEGRGYSAVSFVSFSVSPSIALQIPPRPIHPSPSDIRYSSVKHKQHCCRFKLSQRVRKEIALLPQSLRWFLKESMTICVCWTKYKQYVCLCFVSGAFVLDQMRWWDFISNDVCASNPSDEFKTGAEMTVIRLLWKYFFILLWRHDSV